MHKMIITARFKEGKFEFPVPGLIAQIVFRISRDAPFRRLSGPETTKISKNSS